MLLFRGLMIKVIKLLVFPGYHAFSNRNSLFYKWEGIDKDSKWVFDSDQTKWYDCPRCDAGYEDQKCICEETP
jgi:hypothetical protein